MFLFSKTEYFYCGSSIEVTCTFLSSATMGKLALFNKLLYLLFIRLRFQLGPAVNRACPLNGESFEITLTVPLRYLYKEKKKHHYTRLLGAFMTKLILRLLQIFFNFNFSIFYSNNAVCKQFVIIFSDEYKTCSRIFNF